TGLLHDAETGYHIRVGEYVLQHRSVPTRDFLSFTKLGEPFFAWEWLSGVAFALLGHWDGLRALIVVSALVLALSVLVMIRHLIWRGCNILIALFLIHFAIGASSIHYLARPHMFTLLFMAIALWILDLDRDAPGRAVWILVPLTALWVNLHGGFVALVISIGILAGGSALEWLLCARDPAPGARAIRCSILAGACLLASLLNPYGISEHLHIVQFLREPWYLKLTQEYQSPNFLSVPGAYFGALLAMGIAAAARLLFRRQIGPALLILAWAYASCRSVRNIPIYAIVVLPWLGTEMAGLWHNWVKGKPRKSLAGLLDKIGADYQPSAARTGLFVPITAAILLLLPLGIPYPTDFPSADYPVALVNRYYQKIGESRVFATDAWGDYLTYRYPAPHGIFIDGRTDFFGETFTKQYLDTMNGLPEWKRTFQRYRVDMALIPPDIALAGRLRAQPDWRLLDQTKVAALFVRIPASAPER
ncbi:MAG TPA: hypothetical protein VFW83_09430, partial [Bryobacteraceae bacterium]|nr:hypothetical protein [Bryobacteraceae bacterium]